MADDSLFVDEPSPSLFVDEPYETASPQGGAKPVEEAPEADPYFISSHVNKQEIEAIANKYGVSPDIIGLGVDMKAVQRKMGDSETTPEAAKRMLLRGAGAVSESVGMSVPWKAFKQIAYDKNTQKALDEIEALASERKSYLQATVEAVASPWGGFFAKGVSTAAKAAAAAGKVGARSKQAMELAKLAALSAPTGALAGYGASKTEEELPTIAAGAALGATAPVGLGIAGELAGKTFTKVKDRIKWNKAKKVVTNMVDEMEGQAEKNVSALEDLAKMEDDLATLPKGSPEYETLANEISLEKDRISNLNDVSDSLLAGRMAIPENQKHWVDDPYHDEFPVEILPAHTKYDIVFNADRAYEKNIAREEDIAQNLIQSIKGEELSNPFIWKEILARKFDTEAEAEKYYASFKNKYERRQKWESEYDMELAMSQDLLSLEKRKLAKSLDIRANKNTADKILKDNLEGLGGTGEAGLLKRYESVSKQKYALSYIKKNLDEFATEKLAMDSEDSLLHVSSVFDKMDSKLGTTFTSHHEDLMNALEKVGMESYGFMQHAQTLLNKIGRMEAFRGAEGGKLLSQIIDTGASGAKKLVDFGRLTIDEYNTARELAEFFSDVGMALNTKGLNIPLMKAADGSTNYFPVRMKSSSEVKSILKSEFDTLRAGLEVRDFSSLLDEKKLAEAMAKTNTARAELLSREAQFVKSMSIATGKLVKNKEDLWKAMKSLKDDSDKIVARLNAAKATMQRKGELPELIREYSPTKVIEGYIRDNFKYAAIKEPLAQIKLQQEVAREAGAGKFADYVDEWITDLLSPNEKGWFTKTAEAWKDRFTSEVLRLEKQKAALINATMEKRKEGKIPNLGRYVREHTPEIEEIEKKLERIKFKQDFPELLTNSLRTSFMSGMLGGKIKQGIRDLFQPYTMGIQEIGGGYGTKIMGKATLDYLTSPKSLRKMEEELTEMGQVSKEFAGQLSASREVSDMAGEWAKMGLKGVEKMAHVFMVFRRTAEIINRTTMLNAAKQISSDFMKGDEGAIKFVTKRLGDAYQTKIRLEQARDSLTQENLTKYIAEHLISKTQFRYHPSNKSKLARQYGPFFSQFTHYPSGVVSSISTELRKHGWKAASMRAIAPTVGIMGLNAAFDYLRDEEELSDREKVLLYSSKFSGAAPLTSIPALVVGGGPSAKLAIKTLKLLENPEVSEEYGMKWVDMSGEIAKSFNPAGAAWNFISDMITLATGEKPDVFE